MPLIDVFWLSLESIKANKLRAGLTMLGLIIGVGAVVLLVSIGNGARNYITQEFESLGTNLILVQPGKRDTAGGMGPPVATSRNRLTIGDVEFMRRSARLLDGVSGTVLGNGTYKFEGLSRNADVLGVNVDFFTIFAMRLRQGDFFSEEEDESGRRVVVLGHSIAAGLFPNGGGLGQMIRINESEFRVIGILAATGSKMGWNIDDFSFLPARAAMKLFNQDRLFGIRTRGKAKVGVDDAIEEIREIIKLRNNGEDDVTIITQSSMMDSLNTILSMLTFVLGGIAFISLVVGGIGIMNIMLVSVTERTREIGIRRAVGAKKQDILNQFLVESTVISLIGGGIGLFGSVAITYIVSFFVPVFDMRAPFWVIAFSFGISVMIGVFFGVWPAKKAANVETIEALRYE